MKELTKYTIHWLSSHPADITNFSIVAYITVAIFIGLIIGALVQRRSIEFPGFRLGEGRSSKEDKGERNKSTKGSELSAPPWVSERQVGLKPSIEGATELKLLITRLGDIREWLIHSDTYLINGVEKQIWTIMEALEIEKKLYIATYGKRSQQLRVVSELSQHKDDIAISALESISRNYIVPERVRNEALKLLERRQKSAPEQ